MKKCIATVHARARGLAPPPPKKFKSKNQRLSEEILSYFTYILLHF